MSDVELERMFIRLMGDGSSYQNMLRQAQTSTVAAANVVEKHTDRIQGFGFGLRRFALHAVGAMGLLGGAVGMIGTAIKSVTKAAEAESGMARLNATLEANGRNVAALTTQYEAFAERVQRQTVLDDDAVLSLLRTAETFDLTGAAAERAARNAINLAAAVDGSAASAAQYTRMAIAMERGDIERAMSMARMIPQLARIRDETEFIAAANRLMAVGSRTAAAETRTLAGAFTQFKNAFENMLETLGAGIIEAFALKDVLAIISGLIRGFDQWLKSLTPQMRQWVSVIAAATTALTVFALAWPVLRVVAGAAISLLISTLTTLLSVMGVFKVQQLASLAIWGAWKLVVAAASAVVLIFNAQLAIWKFLLAGGSIATTVATVATSIWAGVVLIAKGATWLFNAALSAMNVLLAPAVLLAAAGTAVILGGAFLGLGGIVGGVVGAIQALITSLPMIAGAAAGPLAAVGGMFAEWWEIVKDVVRAIKVDASLAWDIVRSAATLAVSQIRDLWPPLWRFIQGGFVAVAEYVSVMFAAKMEETMDRIRMGLTRLLLPNQGLGGADDQAIWIEERMAAAVRRATRRAREMMEALTNEFRVVESEETRQARQQIDLLRARIGVVEEESRRLDDRRNTSWRRTVEEVKKFDAALTGSAESIARLQSYIDTFAARGGGTAPALVAGGGGGGGGGGSGGSGVMYQGAVVGYLSRMTDALESLVNRSERDGSMPAGIAG